MKNIVVLISGSGSNLQAIIDACGRKQINGTLRAVFSNKADAFGLERALQKHVHLLDHQLAEALGGDRAVVVPGVTGEGEEQESHEESGRRIVS